MKTIIFIMLLTAFNAKSQELNMDKLLWIVDKWVSFNDDPNTRSYEEWTKRNDALFEGSSRTETGGKVTFEEKLKIEKTPEGIFYEADVNHNPAPVKFRLIEVNDTMAVFENPEHDFPKKITYSLENGNLHAWIEGPGKDGSKKIDFFMTRMR
jgi:hypothetical protein